MYKKYKKKSYVKKKKYVKRYSRPVDKLPKIQRSNEFKYSSTSYSALNALDDGNGLYLLNGIDQGTAQNARVGNKIKMHSIELHLTLSTNVTTTFFVALVYDKQVNQVAMTMANYIQAISTKYLPWSIREPAFKDRFVTLRRWDIDIEPQVSGSYKQKTIHKFVKIPKGVATLYTGSGATITSINMGSVYLIVGSNSNSGPVFSGTHKIRFTDD